MTHYRQAGSRKTRQSPALLRYRNRGGKRAAGTEFTGDQRRERTYRDSVGDVERRRDYGNTEIIAELRRERLEAARVSRAHRNVVTEAGEMPSKGGAEPAACAGDDDGS